MDLNKFIEENIDLIDESNFTKLYDILPDATINTPYLTNILFDCGINPAEGMTVIPIDFAEHCALPVGFKIPDTVVEIKKGAFCDTKATKFDVPEGCVRLGALAFGSNKELRIVNLPSTLQEIEQYCFFGSSRLDNINYNGTLEQWSNIQKHKYWFTANTHRASQTLVHCLDGDCKASEW